MRVRGFTRDKPRFYALGVSWEEACGLNNNKSLALGIDFH